MTVKTGELVRLARPSAPVPLSRFGLGGILVALDLPGKILDMISKFLDYRKELKRLEEEERQAALCHHRIDAAYRSHTEGLEQRSRCIRELLAQTSAELARARVDSRTIALGISRLIDTIASPDTPVEGRKACQEALEVLVKLRTKEMRHARSIFGRAARTTQALLSHSPNLQDVPALPEE